MNFILTLLGFIILVFLIYQIATGFPLISIISDKKRKKEWDRIQELRKVNEQKIKLLDKNLSGKNDIETYVSLNMYNLPDDEKWRTLLPNLIKDLLAIGWTTEMGIYTKLKYGKYEMRLINANQDIIYKAITVVNKYEDQYEALWD